VRLFAPQIIGSRVLAQSITYRATASATSIAGVNLGDMAPGRNQKWCIVVASYSSASGSASITVSGTVAGLSASLIYNVRMVRGPSNSLIDYFALAVRIDGETSGNVVITDNTSVTPRLAVFTMVNIDGSNDTHAVGNVNVASRSHTTSCNAGGGILAIGEIVSFNNITSSGFNNLTSADHVGGSTSRHAHGIGLFVSAQSGLNVGYVPQPSSNANQSAIALSFAGI